MAINFEAEAVIEDKLIQQLVHGESQWTLREDLKTVDDLWQNFKDILVRHNKELFDQHPLTDEEFKQVQNQLKFSSFYDAAKWLTGENGIARVSIVREDASLGTVRPIVFKRSDVAGGSSVYEVVHQIKFDKKEEGNRNRRSDVTLLINGLPMIHIELKNRNHSYMEAFYQIQKYMKEGVFWDIYSTVQMFVVSNGTDTKYIAASQKLNKNFLTGWLDTENNPVTDYLSFAKEVLSIPAAHNLVSLYSVLDSEREEVILLRPYQIHAIEAIWEAMKRRKSGFIWHTTGSGKTLTAYKASRNCLSIPSVDKMIFLVDRKDLDNQTTGSFKAYAEYDTTNVEDTNSTRELEKKLVSTERNVIVTTIQKLGRVIKRQKPDKPRYKKLRDLDVVFIVDECHRAVSAEAQQNINKFFKRTLWYGFTGTPIFAEDAKNSPGNLAKTTAEQYGDCLHKYTIKEAIHDGSVLGFQVEYQTTINEETVIKQADIGTGDIVKEEQQIYYTPSTKDIYADDAHMLSVIDYIVNKAAGKLGLARGRGQAYSAILTTSSIAMAQRYYELFKEVKEGKNSLVKISDHTKSLANDFPKFAITYSLTENEEDSSANQTKMKESLKDYNAMFGTKFGLEDIPAYNNNVNDRLARKKKIFSPRDEQLDLVIVVDRLLTGFDAPCLSTLFIDRKPMRSYSIIQAFSRTNRLFDAQKKFGQIVSFQSPEWFKQSVDKAIQLYSSGGGNYITAPEWEEAETNFKKALAELRSLAPTPDAVNALTKRQKKTFLKLYKAFDEAYADIQVYTEYEAKDLERDYHITKEEIENYYAKYKDVREELKGDEGDGGGGDDGDFVIDYELRSVHTDQIDYEYILALMEAMTRDEETNEPRLLPMPMDQEKAKEITEQIERFAKTNPKLAEVLDELWQDFKENPAAYAGKSLLVEFRQRVHEKIRLLVHDFANHWCVSEDALQYFVDNYDLKLDDKTKQVGQDELRETTDRKAYAEKNPNGATGLKYWRAFLTAARTLVANEIAPLREM